MFGNPSDEHGCGHGVLSFLTAMGLFIGQSAAFFMYVAGLVAATDAAQRGILRLCYYAVGVRGERQSELPRHSYAPSSTALRMSCPHFILRQQGNPLIEFESRSVRGLVTENALFPLGWSDRFNEAFSFLEAAWLYQ
jgi:hypothetical protein